MNAQQQQQRNTSAVDALGMIVQQLPPDSLQLVRDALSLAVCHCFVKATENPLSSGSDDIMQAFDAAAGRVAQQQPRPVSPPEFRALFVDQPAFFIDRGPGSYGVRLVRGCRYDEDNVLPMFDRWADAAGLPVEAPTYNVADYFDRGVYLGADSLGIEPVFSPQ